MVQIDWKEFIGIKPETLSEQEKDNLYNTVSQYVPDTNVSKKYLLHFVRVTQEVMKFKHEQVEYLTNELDEIAERQGKEEGDKFNQYISEIDQLREELEYYKKLEKNSNRSTHASNEELKREIVKLEMQNEELLSTLKEKERDLVSEKEEVEKYAAQVASLEREKQELSREVKALQEEAANKSVEGVKDSPEFDIQKQENLSEMVRLKNKHISQLLEDIEMVEKENFALQTKLSSVRDELSETTSHMTEITAELSRLKHLNKDYEAKNMELVGKIQSLTAQVEELVEEKNKHDQQLDEYIKMFTGQFEDWKAVIDEKDEEILKLKEEVMKEISHPATFNSLDLGEKKLNMTIVQQEKEIEILKEELQKATEEINSSTELIEKLKEKLQLMSAPQQSESMIGFYEEKIRVLEEKLVCAEEDATVKAEEMSNLVIQLREYESGVFGLSEAVETIKRLERRLEEKDFQIEKLVEICNNLEIELDNFEEQNMALRERLGLTALDEIDTSVLKLKYRKDEELLRNLKMQLDKKEEELLKAKLKYRKVIKHLKTQPPAPAPAPEPPKIAKPTCEDLKKLSEKLKAVIKENNALRKGMHEILESIRQQDTYGTVHVQSTCLERLLEALDSRHVNGWYHPAMRLQAQLNTEEGKNEELRNQIRSLRTEEKKRVSELQNAYLKIQTLENDLSTPRYEEETEDVTKEKTSEEEVKSVSDLQLPKPISVDADREQKIIQLESELHELKLNLTHKKLEVEKLNRTFAEEKEKFLSRITELECRTIEFKNQNVESVSNISKLSVLERKMNFLETWESSYRETNEKLKQEMIEEEEKMLKEVLKLQNDKSVLWSLVEKLEKDVLNAVSKEKYDSMEKELVSMRTKYQQLVNLSLTKEEDKSSEKLMNEINLLQNEKQQIADELRTVKEKLIATEGLTSENVVTKGDFSSEISSLAGKLAASEVREMMEKQKSDHLEKLNAMLKSQQDEVETRSKELQEQVMKLTEDVGKLQNVERDLRTKALRELSQEDRSVLQNKIECLEEKCRELTTEKDNTQELLDISQGQCRAFQERKDEDKILLDSLKEQILLLQSTEDDKAAISRLSHELAMAKLSISQLHRKNADLRMRVTKFLTKNVALEMKINENSREFFNAKKEHLALVSHLYESMDEVRNLYVASVRFREVENIHNTKLELNETKKELSEKMKSLKLQMKEYLLKKEEMETQLDSLEDLKQALNGDTKNLLFWHNKNTELRLKEAKCRRENEFLVGEISQLESKLKKINDEITAVEEENAEKEKEWEKKQILWEKAQLQMCQLLKGEGGKKKTVKLSDAATNTESIPESVPDKDQERQAVEWKVQELEADVDQLKRDMEVEKIKTIATKEFSNGSKRLEETIFQETIGSSEKEAFKVTIQSLQDIIQQKEETIVRYQNLLKEGREEYGKSCAKFQSELQSLNEKMAAQCVAYNKLKNAVQTSSSVGDSIPAIVEKYVTKIHELEEELADCQASLTSAAARARTSQQEVDKWKKLAEERLLLGENAKQRVEEEWKKETESYKEKISGYDKEIERLNQEIETLRSEVSKKAVNEGQLMQTVQNLQENEHIRSMSDQLSDCTYDNIKKAKNNRMTQEMESLKKQLKMSIDESVRLKEQVRLLQSRTVKTARTGSSTSRSDPKLTGKEESLTAKVKHLEELLTVSKDRERELMEMNQKKIKSVEEVTRWEERKKSQQTIQQLTAKIKEKETEVEVLRNKNESFRNMVYKCERDKNILEAQLKMVKSGSGGFAARFEKLQMEKSQLEVEVDCLRSKLEEQLRHSGGLGAALLQGKLEEQERKLAAFELASKGQTAMIDELERLKATIANLEKSNLKLESENLSLQLKLEKEKAESKYLLNKVKHSHSQEAMEEVNSQQPSRTMSKLYRTIEKLTEENRQLRLKEPGNVGEKIRCELAKLREDNQILRARYMETVERNISLEKEIKSCHYQIHLMEEKDLAEVLTKSNIQSSSDLSQELTEVKAKLAHKTHLLSRVKALLIKAAAKEKALHQKVCFLQSVVPHSG